MIPASAPTDNPGCPAPRFDLVALDLDGTLLRSDKQLSRYDAVAITEARRRGVKVVIATARPPRSSRQIHRRLGLDTPLINYNGALIHDVAGKAHLAHQPLDRQAARQIIDLARGIDPGVVVSIETLDRWYTDHDDPAIKTETAKRFKPDFIGPLEVPLRQAVTKLMLLAPAPRLAPVREAVMGGFAGRAAFRHSQDTIMEIVHPSVDKSVGLAWVAGRLGVAPERCCAIGDAANDAGMLRWAGLGLAVANALGPVRDAADAVLPHDNDDWAVGRAIEQHVLADDPVARTVAAFNAGA